MTSKATRHCSRCTTTKRESSFDRSVATGRLYKICRNCKASAKDKQDKAKMKSTPQHELDALWIAHYPVWHEAGHREATAPITPHTCNGPMLVTRLLTDEVFTHNEILLYCNRCLTVWRTGKHAQNSDSMLRYYAAIDARYAVE